MQTGKKEIEVTAQLIYRLYPERLKDDVSTEAKTEVKTLTEEELKSEKITIRRILYYDYKSKSYKSTDFNNR